MSRRDDAKKCKVEALATLSSDLSSGTNAVEWALAASAAAASSVQSELESQVAHLSDGMLSLSRTHEGKVLALSNRISELEGALDAAWAGTNSARVEAIVRGKEVENDLSACHSRISSLQAALEAKDREMAEARESAGLIVARLQKELVETLATAAAGEQAASTARNQAEATLGGVRAELSSERMATCSLRAAAAQLEGELRCSIVALSDQVKRLEGDLARAGKDAADTQMAMDIKIEQLALQLSAAESERNALQFQHVGMTAERDTLFTQLIEMGLHRDTLLSQSDGLVLERDGLVLERCGLISERDGLASERDTLLSQRDGLVFERDGLVSERDGLVSERDRLV